MGEGKVIYARAIEMGTDEVYPYLVLGEVALFQGDLEEAEQRFNQASAIKPEHPPLLAARGRLKLAQGRAQEARELLEEALRRGERSGTLGGALGDLYVELGLWEQAVIAYKKALKYAIRNSDWRCSMGITLVRMGKMTEAKQKFREVLALTPDDVEAWQELHKLGASY